MIGVGTVQKFLIIFIFTLPFAFLDATPPLRIQPVGDSITAGYTDVPTWINPYEFGYMAPLLAMLTEKGIEVQYVGQSAEPWNGLFGIPTNTPSPDLRRLGQNHHRGYGTQPSGFLNENIEHWLREDQPDMVLLMVGINDIFSGETRDPIQTKINLSNLVYTITQQAPEVFVVVAQITPYNLYTGSVVLYNQFIQKELVPSFQRSGANVSSVDQYSNFLWPGTTNIDETTLSNGYNHPSNVGYARMASTWFDAIYPLIEKQRQRLQIPNMLVNGGFELPKLGLGSQTNFPINSSWGFTKIGETGSAGIQNRSFAESHLGEGSQMAFLKSQSSSSRIALSQVVSQLVPDHFYELTFLARNASDAAMSSPITISIAFNATNRIELFGSNPVSPPPQNEFIRYISAPFTAASALGRLSFTIRGQEGAETSIQLDDIQIKEVITGPVHVAIDAGRITFTFAANANLEYWVDSMEAPFQNAQWNTVGRAKVQRGGKYFYAETMNQSTAVKWFRIRPTLRFME